LNAYAGAEAAARTLLQSPLGQVALNGNPIGLIDAIGYPIAADTGLVPLALFIEGESVLETAGVNFGNI
jgi:hypothetical protein